MGQNRGVLRGFTVVNKYTAIVPEGVEEEVAIGTRRNLIASGGRMLLAKSLVSSLLKVFGRP